MTVNEILTRARIFLGDQRKGRFTDEEMIVELNAVLRESSAEMGWFRQTAGIPVRDAQRIYELPTDLIKLKTIALDSEFRGAVIMARTYRDVVVAGSSANDVSASRYWGFPVGSPLGSALNPVYFKDTVSNNEFVIEPPILAEDPQPAESYDEPLTWAP